MTEHRPFASLGTLSREWLNARLHFRIGDLGQLAHRPHPRDDRAERRRIREIAQTRIRYGAERIHVLLRREGWLINHKKTYRIYCEEGLNLRRKRPRRRVAAAHRMERPEISTVNACWSMDFVADQLFNGQKIRALTVVDNFSR